MVFFVVGIVFIANLLGFLVGASESPVAGIALTATFGIVATGLALHQRAFVSVPPDSPSASAPIKAPTEGKVLEALKSLGIVLITFSVAFAIGLAIGIAAKVQSHRVDKETKIFWEGVQAPTSARKAIDWLIVRKRLNEIGYTDGQVLSIYKLDVERSKTDEKKQFPWTSDDLLSPLLSSPAASAPSQSNGNFIAEDPSFKKREGHV